ncbi:MAG: DUF5067 domain-containing protein [Clostridiales bacterium]|nr:DUF5067 domain-containing protein [Clostridiales bacterium]
MIKKLVLLFLVLMLACPLALAEDLTDAEAETLRQLKQVVMDFLDNEEYTYETNEDGFSLGFALDGKLESCLVVVTVYYDGIEITATPNLEIPEQNRDKVAVLLALINHYSFYSHLGMRHETGKLYSFSDQLVEQVLPGMAEMNVLFHEPLHMLEKWGEGLMKVALEGADPVACYTKIKAGEPLDESVALPISDAQNSPGQTGDAYLLSGTYDGALIGLKEVLTQDEGDDKILILVFDFSHDKDEAQMFSLAANITVYQDGIELDDAYFYKHASQGNAIKNIKRGAVLETTKAYTLRSNSPVEIEMNEFFSFNDRKPDAITVPVP